MTRLSLLRQANSLLSLHCAPFVSSHAVFCIVLPAGQVECAQLLIQAQASVSADCDGCPCLHMATCTGALPGREAAALQLVQLLLEAGADSIQRCARQRILHDTLHCGKHACQCFYQVSGFDVRSSSSLTYMVLAVGRRYACRDDCGRLALHWSAELGLAEVCQLLLQATTEAAAALTARVAAASADAEAGEEPPQLELPNLLEMQVAAQQLLALQCCVCPPHYAHAHACLAST
jgi:ankyrin repeat protein